MAAILEVRDLTKTYGDFKAVDHVSFTVERGDVYGFLGENGAGKSTTLRMILGLIRPTSGTVRIGGEDAVPGSRAALRRIGAVVERPDLYGYLSGWDNLKLFARLSVPGISKARLEETIALVGLSGREGDKVKAYSQGMKQRLGIAIALAHDPDLLILDEPTNGLDPQGIAEMRNLILHLAKDRGKTVIISSHLLYEIEQTATRMIIIHKGKKMVEGRVDALLDPAETLMEVQLAGDDDVAARLPGSPWAPLLQESAAGRLLFKMHPEQTPALVDWLSAARGRILQLRSRHSLEAFFLSLTTDPA